MPFRLENFVIVMTRNEISTLHFPMLERVRAYVSGLRKINRIRDTHFESTLTSPHSYLIVAT